MGTGKWVALGSVALALVACGGGPMGGVGMDAGPGDDVYTPPWDGGSAVHMPTPVDLECVATFSSAQRGVTDVLLDPDGGVVIFGALTGDQDLDPGPAVEPFVLTRLDHPESYVTRFDENCQYQWTRVFDTLLQVRDVGIASGLRQIVVSGGGESGAVDFDPTSGADRRSDLDYPFVTRLGLDGSYVSTTGRECFLDICTTGGAQPPMAADSLAVAADGTAYVSDRELLRYAADGTHGWAAIPPDAGVPVGGAISVAPDGVVWASELLPTGEVAYDGSGPDRPGSLCRAGDTTCAERQLLVRVNPDGSYGGNIATTFGLLSMSAPMFDDGSPDPFVVGIFYPPIFPDLDPGPGVDHREPTGMQFSLYAERLTLAGDEVWASVEAGSGDSTGGSPMVALNDAALDRAEDVLYRVGTQGGLLGGFPIEQPPAGAWIAAQTLDGDVLFAAYSPGMSLDHVDAAGGRIAVIGSVNNPSDLDFTWDGVAPSTASVPDFAIALYRREMCVDGTTVAAMCADGSRGELRCTGGRFGPIACATPQIGLGATRRCLGCDDLDVLGVACGTHDDGCGASVSCGTCPAPMVCGGTGRTCGGTAGSPAIATGLNHPGGAMELDATHVYFVTSNDLPPHGMLPGDVTVMRVLRDGSAPAQTLATAGPNVRLAVSATHVYLMDPDAHTLSRLLKDGSGAIEVVASDLFSPSRPVVDGDYVYFTAARASSPLHVFELQQYDAISNYVAVADSMGDVVTAAMVDDTYVWATSMRFAGMYRWPRGEVGTPVIELVPAPPASVTGWLAPGLGYFDGTEAWTVTWGDWRRHTWLGTVQRGDVLASSGLNHPAGIVGDANGLFVSIAGDLTIHGDTGEIRRIW